MALRPARAFDRTLAALAAALTLVSACGSDSPSTPGATLTAISVVPRQVTLDPGASVRLAAELRWSDGTVESTTNVSWTSSAEQVARVAADGTVTAAAAGTATITALSQGVSGTATINVRDVLDVDVTGVPRFITSDYIELGKIDRISRFRSGIGHDYSDAVESCRSMKHYFMPRSRVDWASVAIFAPADGVIVDVQPEQTFASQVHLRPTALTSATIILFHVVPDSGVTAGASVASGQRIGHHVGSQTMSDVAVRVESPAGPRYVSYFDAMTDAVFDAYSARGAAARADFIISRAQRDANPLVCNGQSFTSAGTISNWVVLD